MREILFRGKCTDSGEWVQGNLTSVKYNIANKNDCRYKHSDSCFIESFEISDSCQCGVCEEVIPETVGQYTGLTDKNGTKIFEGDILRFGEETYYVSWGNDDLQYQKVSIDGGTPILESFECFYAGHSEVIGNIYDNPELLEGNE